jgi:hypothetical protein
MRTLVVVGQIYMHIDSGNRVLKSIPAVSHGDGISEIFYTNLIDGYFAIIRLALNVLHLSAQAPGL